KVSVMGHGMGIPSASIYTTELINHYNVKNIIRVGTCGSVSADIKVRDIIIAMGACTDSGVNRTRFNGYDFAAIANYNLLETAVNTARENEIPVKVGNVFSADLFYNPDPTMFDYIEKYNVLGVEMEVAGIYGVAAEFGANALAICTVSDHIRTHEVTTPEERQTTFNKMIEIALDTAAKIA
ncbi:MAG: purine-nucleoside phosphorylase, partial [Psittacicella sp.]